MYPLKFVPFPELHSERLHLRELNEEDVEAIYSLRSNEAVNTYINRPLATHRSDARYFIHSMKDGILAGEWVYWGICIKEWPEVIGTICLWEFSRDWGAEIGYEMHPDFQGMGYMREAARAVLAYGFEELNLSYIIGIMHAQNQPSRRLMDKLGFGYELTLSKAEKSVRESSIGMVKYRLDKEDWQSQS
jgi:ribosomal-protein-alanine N-acetyltransferase